MSRSPSSSCRNCSTESESPFQYCPNCGQKNTDGRITFTELWSEFQDAVFNVNSKTWRTLKYLFVPGKLTLEYFSGKHRRYVHPLRLLLVTSVLVVIAMSLQDFQATTNHTYDVRERMLLNYERQRIYGILESITDSTKATLPAQQTVIVADTILAAFTDSMQALLYSSDNESANKFGDKYGDTINLSHYIGKEGGEPQRIAKRDFLYMDQEELTAAYMKDAGILERIIFKQKVKFINDESQLFAVMLGNTTWAVLLMMPCLALVLYLLYVRHRYYYIEHLIFAFHLQSFSFLVLTAMIAGLYFFPWWLLFILLLVIWVYTFFSMWRVYGQSVGKTLLKWLILIVSYCGLFFVILLGTILISFLLL
ncbi:MAG: DUF3667 domain-containing protein [Saprospiraceae bacterium]